VRLGMTAASFLSKSFERRRARQSVEIASPVAAPTSAGESRQYHRHRRAAEAHGSIAFRKGLRAKRPLRVPQEPTFVREPMRLATAPTEPITAGDPRERLHSWLTKTGLHATWRPWSREHAITGGEYGDHLDEVVRLYCQGQAC